MTDIRRLFRILLILAITAGISSCGTIRTYGGIEHDYEYDFDGHGHHHKHHKHKKHKKHKKHHHHHHDGFYERCDDDDDDD